MIGIYSSGAKQFATENDYIADETAVIIGHKIKQIILGHCDPEANVDVTARNAVPSKDADFTNPMCEYRTYIKI
uniref:Uncharacterized protein n=1 Tax=Panagrolaimus sp. ES5 TaxID=591445 RepID=A0AC34FSB2_9BILA